MGHEHTHVYVTVKSSPLVVVLVAVRSAGWVRTYLPQGAERITPAVCDVGIIGAGCRQPSQQTSHHSTVAAATWGRQS